MKARNRYLVAVVILILFYAFIALTFSWTRWLENVLVGNIFEIGTTAVFAIISGIVAVVLSDMIWEGRFSSVLGTNLYASFDQAFPDILKAVRSGGNLIVFVASNRRYFRLYEKEVQDLFRRGVTLDVYLLNPLFDRESLTPNIYLNAFATKTDLSWQTRVTSIVGAMKFLWAQFKAVRNERAQLNIYVCDAVPVFTGYVVDGRHYYFVPYYPMSHVIGTVPVVGPLAKRHSLSKLLDIAIESVPKRKVVLDSLDGVNDVPVKPEEYPDWIRTLSFEGLFDPPFSLQEKSRLFDKAISKSSDV